MKTRHTILSFILLASAIAISGGAALRAADGDAAQRDAITKAAGAFVAAFAKGDAKAVAACWTVDGDFIDEAGRVVKGRKAIEEDFAKFFAENKGLTVRIEIGSLQFPTADTAIEDGASSVLMPDGSAPSRARYTNFHVKKDGQWLLSSVREAPFIPPSNYEHLRGLEWAIGEWMDSDSQGHVGRVTFEWSPDNNFILSTRAVDVKGAFMDNGSQRIGWDPAGKRIRSWSFETDGGFGESAWTKDGENKWVITTSSVLQGGGLMTATNIVTRVDADTLTVQSTQQQLNGKMLPDSAPVTMKRVK